MKYKLIFISFVACLFLVGCLTPTPTGQVKHCHLGSDFQKIAEKTLAETWNNILNNNYDTNRKNGEWEKILHKNQPLILKSTSNTELLASINLMIEELEQSHIRLFPPMSRREKKAIEVQQKTRKYSKDSSASLAKKRDKREKNQPADPGLRLCVADGKVLVLDVRKKSPADNARIKMGDEIISIYGLKVETSINTDSPWDAIIENMLAGNRGTIVSIKIRNRKGKIEHLKLKREQIPGSRWIRLGAMPKFSGKVEHKLLKDNIGYIFFSPCFPQQIVEMNRLIRHDFKDVKGLILDVRNNPGGMMLVPQGIAGWVSEKKLNFGKMIMRGMPLKLESYPQESAFTGPLAILMNKGTGSAAEVFAAGMQDNKRAELFGEKTSGKCLPSMFLILSTGFRLQTVFGKFIRFNGKPIEKKGVIPNFSLPQKKEDLISGIDSVREAARKYLLKQKI